MVENKVVVDMDTKELEALILLHYSPVDENGGVLCPLGYIEGQAVILARSLTSSL